jgi:thiol:disulfide interchange protein DsbC
MFKKNAIQSVVLLAVCVTSGVISYHATKSVEESNKENESKLVSVAPAPSSPSNKTLSDKEMQDFAKIASLQLKRIFSSPESQAIKDVQFISGTGFVSVFTKGGEHVVFDINGNHVALSDRNGIRIVDLVNTVDLTDRARSSQLAAVFKEHDPFYVNASYKDVEKLGTLFVAKDPQCGYCKKLEGEIPALNAAGIEVQSYPLAIFPGSDYMMRISACTTNPMASYHTFSNVARDLRTKATDEASDLGISTESEKMGLLNDKIRKYAGDNFEMVPECSYPVTEISQDIKSVGISGTPVMMTSEGQIVRGYVPAETIIKSFKD